MSKESNEIYEFGPFRLDVGEHIFQRTDGVANGSLPEKAFQTLVVLLRNQGRLVTKNQLLDAVWPDSIVEENNLDKAIHAVRHVLGETPAEHKYIETVRKHGYRFVADVCRVDLINGPPSLAPNSVEAAKTDQVEVDSAPARGQHFGNAFEAYQQARIKYYQMTGPTAIESRALIFEAMRLDPEFAPTYSLAAELTTLEVIVGLKSPADGFPEAREAISRAYALKADSADFYAAAGYVYLIADWNFTAAERSLRKALAKNAHHSSANRMLGEVFMFQGRHDEAAAYIEQAQTDEITALINTNILAISRFLARDFGAVIEICDRMLTLYPRFIIAAWTRCWALEQMGRMGEAIEGYEKILGQPHGGLIDRWIGHAYALVGDREKALATAEKLIAESQAHYLSPTHLAQLYAALDDADRAFHYLEMGIAERDPWMLWVKADPRYDGLRGHERFDEIVNKTFPQRAEAAIANAPAQAEAIYSHASLPNARITASGQHAMVDVTEWRDLVERLDSASDYAEKGDRAAVISFPADHVEAQTKLQSKISSETTALGAHATNARLRLVTNDYELTDSNIDAELAPIVPISPVVRKTRRWMNLKLNWKLLTATAVVLLAAFLVFLVTTNPPLDLTGENAAIDSIAVLPFGDGADPNSEYLSEGIAENLIDRLSRLPNFKVMSRNAVTRYKTGNIDAKTVGDELQVKAILTGNLVHRDDRVLLSVELINAQDNSRMWGARYERKLTEILAVQNEIGQKIVERLNLNLTGEQLQSFNRRYTESAEAYQFYLKGRHLWNKRTGENLRRAVDFFNLAVAADPNYAPAYAGLADCYALYSSYEVASGADSFPKAKAMAGQALALDDTLAEAHTSLAYVLYRFEWNWAAAEREFKRAVELNPNYATGRHWYGEYLGAAGRFDEAFVEQQTALLLDPSSFIIHLDFGWNYYLARRYDDAISQFQKARMIEPQSSILDYVSSATYEQAGKYAEAAEACLAAMQTDGFDSAQIASLKRILQVSGYKAFKRAVLEMRTQKYRLSSVENASNRAFLGDREAAFTLLDKAMQNHDSDLIYVKFNPSFDNLRDDPRFDQLVKRIGLN